VNQQGRKGRSRSGRIALSVGILLLLLSIVRPYQISEISMLYGLKAGDWVVVENLSAGVHVPSWGFFVDRHIYSHESGIHRGDLLAFRHPLDQRLYLKRCVALPGDSLFQEAKNLYLQIRSDSEATRKYGKRYGLALIKRPDGYWLKNPYRRYYPIVHIPSVVGPKMLIDYPRIRLKPHMYFMMGDFRDNSTDSRFFGPVPYDAIYYKVWFILKHARSMRALGDIRWL